MSSEHRFSGKRYLIDVTSEGGMDGLLQADSKETATQKNTQLFKTEQQKIGNMLPGPMSLSFRCDFSNGRVRIDS